MVNRAQFELSSDGPDREFMTSHDVRAEITVESRSVVQQEEDAANAGGSDLLSGIHPLHPWLVVRKAEIAAKKAQDAGQKNASVEQFLPTVESEGTQTIAKQNHDFKITWQVGGATTLTGAAYFKFFTWVMLVTAILFVVVGYFYKPKTYIQDEMSSP